MSPEPRFGSRALAKQYREHEATMAKLYAPDSEKDYGGRRRRRRKHSRHHRHSRRSRHHRRHRDRHRRRRHGDGEKGGHRRRSNRRKSTRKRRSHRHSRRGGKGTAERRGGRDERTKEKGRRRRKRHHSSRRRRTTKAIAADGKATEQIAAATALFEAAARLVSPQRQASPQPTLPHTGGERIIQLAPARRYVSGYEQGTPLRSWVSPAGTPGYY